VTPCALQVCRSTFTRIPPRGKVHSSNGRPARSNLAAKGLGNEALCLLWEEGVSFHAQGLAARKDVPCTTRQVEDPEGRASSACAHAGGEEAARHRAVRSAPRYCLLPVRGYPRGVGQVRDFSTRPVGHLRALCYKRASSPARRDAYPVVNPAASDREPAPLYPNPLRGGKGGSWVVSALSPTKSHSSLRSSSSSLTLRGPKEITYNTSNKGGKREPTFKRIRRLTLGR
jgi:hypothetical protein